MHHKLIFALFALLFSGLIITFHFVGEPNSMFTLTPFQKLGTSSTFLSNPYLEETIRYHESEWTFSKRLVFTYFIHFFSGIFSLSASLSFVLLNAILLFICGYLIGRLSHFKSFSTSSGLLAQCCFYASFSILFCFFAPIYTYDDFLQLFFLLTGAGLLHLRQWVLAGLFVVSAIFTRETSLLFIPLLWMFNDCSLRKNIYFSLICCIPFVVYHLIQTTPVSVYIQERLSYLVFNFQNNRYATESLLSFISACFLPFTFGWFRWKAGALSQKIFIIVFSLNVLLVFCFAHAREARLFFMPVFLMLPHTIAKPLRFTSLRKSSITTLVNKNYLFLLSFCLTLCIVFLGIHFFYRPTIAKTSEVSMELYFSLVISLMFFQVFASAISAFSFLSSPFSKTN